MYAEHLADTHRFEPSRTYKYGENLATSFRRNKVDAVKDGKCKRYDVITMYCNSNIYCMHSSCHVTIACYKMKFK